MPKIPFYPQRGMMYTLAVNFLSSPQVEILGAKDTLMGSKITGQSKLKLDPAQTLQSLLGDHPVLTMADNYIEPYLMTKSIVHPPLMYARWKDWDGQPLAEKPLFYQVRR